MDLFGELSQPLQTEIEIKHPVTDKGTGIFITLLSKNHPEVRDHARRRLEARVIKAGRKGRLSVDDLEEEATDALIVAIRDWRGITKNGEPLPCTPANVRELLESPSHRWLREQIDTAVNDDAGFFLK